MDLTRRGHKARMAITLWFPNEVMTEIIRNVSRADQATLCRVSKIFNALSLPVLNRTVTIVGGLDNNQVHVLKAFCTALIAHPFRADAIRSLTFVGRGYIRTELEDSESRELWLQSVKLMRRLEHLSIDSSRVVGQLVPKLSLLNFPRILRCSLKIPADMWHVDDVAAFLKLHATLTHVRIRINGPVGHRSVSLPNLQYFDGYMAHLPSIVTQHLRAARILWQTEGLEIDNFIKALTSMTDPSIPFISSHRFHTSLDDTSRILTALSTRMPHTTTLETCYLDFQAAVGHITERLGQFGHLHYLAFDSIYRIPDSDEDDAYRQDTLQAWSNACPTLKACSLFARAWRKVDDMWQEYPMEDFLIQAGLSAFEELS
ncbi:hypothetical protein DFH07DRAFT_843051 [Mycena maculata]|uniref:F-box domain-containing protein n=1 Tax=Mycena maculata TaxID=230809 RepID=A0AAD7I851_9AGAR|nr:hypothetical protein DFH07DRAFT_843051 [Mycena maculata]